MGILRPCGGSIWRSGEGKELDTLLAQAPVDNFASYEVHPLAEMRGPTPIGTTQAE